MASSVLATRQSAFKGADAEVVIEEDGVEYKAFELQDLSNNLIYLKRATDKGAACTAIAADGTITRIAVDGDGITFGFDKGQGSVTIAAALATDGDDFSWLAFVL